MKKIYETVSDMIFPAVVFAAILAILTGAFLLQRVGKRMEVEKEDFSGMKDTQAVEVVCERDAPVITCTGKRNFHVGEIVEIPEVFRAQDAEGEELDVLVDELVDVEGNSVIDLYQEANRKAVFKRKGVYIFTLSSMDYERKHTQERFSISVN